MFLRRVLIFYWGTIMYAFKRFRYFGFVFMLLINSVCGADHPSPEVNPTQLPPKKEAPFIEQVSPYVHYAAVLAGTAVTSYTGYEIFSSHPGLVTSILEYGLKRGALLSIVASGIYAYKNLERARMYKVSVDAYDLKNLAWSAVGFAAVGSFLGCLEGVGRYYFAK